MGRLPASTLLLLLAFFFVVSSETVHLSSNDLIQLATSNPQHAFNLWASQHGRKYASAPHGQEAVQRLGAWLGNVKTIQELSAENPEAQFELNDFADLTFDEFRATHLGYDYGLHQRHQQEKAANTAASGLRGRRFGGSSRFLYEDTDPPAAMDWVQKGAVTPVKNQGSCGSCWAFSATGAVEGVNQLVTGALVSVSEQELVDCDSEKDMGCGGGLMDYAFEYMIKNGGIDTEQDYGYWSGWGTGLWCNRRKEHDRTAVTIDGYQDVPKNEAALRKAVANQPVAVGLCATTLQFYAGGVLSKCCSELNHGVLLVGYDTAPDGTHYWLIKNSWGGDWGEKGYFRLKMGMGPEGLCGVASAASFPIKTSPNHPVPEICDFFGFFECPVASSCSCSFNLLGLFCVWHDCCPVANGVSCSDMQHCCPGDLPVCDTQQGRCVSEDGSSSAPWIDKTGAQVTPGNKAGAGLLANAISGSGMATATKQQQQRLSVVAHKKAAGQAVDGGFPTS